MPSGGDWRYGDQLLARLGLASNGYDLSWWAADRGRGLSMADSYNLSGNAGQHDAVLLTGGSYSLAGGSWSVTQTG